MVGRLDRRDPAGEAVADDDDIIDFVEDAAIELRAFRARNVTMHRLSP